MTVLPNPFIDQLQVHVDAPVEQQALLRVTDLKGMELFSTHVMLSKGGTTLGYSYSLDFLPAGSYFLSIEGESMQLLQRIVKQ